jgi:uncharacterized membrane protein YwzB
MSVLSRLSAEARGTAAVALAYLLMALLWAAPSSLSPTDTLPDLGDPLHLSYVMAWDAHQLVHRPWALYDSNSFYPYARSLAFGDHLLPEALMVAPVNWLTGNAVLASNVGVVLALWLSALAMFVLVRGVTGSAGAAFLSGLMYAFNSFTRHELLRVHVLNLEWWPLALFFLDRFVRQGRGRDARLFALMLTLQGLSGTYYLVYSFLLGPLWLAGAYLLVRRLPSRDELRTLAGALLLSGVPAIVVLSPYLVHFRSMGFEKSWAAGADVLSYFDPSPGSWLWGGIELLARHPEVPHFMGFVGFVLIVAGAVHVLARRSTGRAVGLLALATAVIGFVLSLGPALIVGGRNLGAAPYAFLYAHVRLLRGMASPERIGVLVVLGGAILAGVAIAAVLDRMAGGMRAGAVALLAVLLPFEHWTTPAAGVAVPTGQRVPSVYRWLAEGPAEPIVELPLYPERAKRLRSAYLYFSTYHWRPIPIGRTSFYPPAHDFLAWELRGFPDDTSVILLDRLGIRTIVVHPLSWDPAQREARLVALDAQPRLALVRSFDDVPQGAYEPLGLGAERVYRIVGQSRPVARLCEPEDELPREGWAFRHSGRKKPDLVRDGDRRTAWFTHIPQRPDDFLDVILPRRDTVAAAVLELYYPHEEFPRNLAVFASDDAESWRRVPWSRGPEESWAVLDELLRRPREARLVVRFDPQELSALSLRIGSREQEDAWPQWSIPELRLYRACR